MEVDLPSDIGGSDYSLSLYNGVRVSVNQNTYEKNFNGLNNRYDFEGTTDGGTVKIYKQEDNFILRARIMSFHFANLAEKMRRVKHPELYEDDEEEGVTGRS